MDNRNIINEFYSAFQSKDADTMVSFYHDEVTFNDPAFGILEGSRAKAMWKMLCANAQDLTIEYKEVTADQDSGSAHWDAYYTFRQTGRKVHNIIDAKFEFIDGKIIRHTDSFDLRKWAGQAMGWKGSLLGSTSFFRQKIQKQTNKLLDKYMESHL